MVVSSRSWMGHLIIKTKWLMEIVFNSDIWGEHKHRLLKLEGSNSVGRTESWRVFHWTKGIGIEEVLQWTRLELLSLRKTCVKTLVSLPCCWLVHSSNFHSDTYRNGDIVQRRVGKIKNLGNFYIKYFLCVLLSLVLSKRLSKITKTSDSPLRINFNKYRSWNIWERLFIYYN